MDSGEDNPLVKRRGGDVWKFVILTIVLATIAIGFVFFRNQLTFDSLATQETALREAKDNHPLQIFGIAFLLYVTITGLSLPGAAALTLLFGWYFGFLPALILVSFASTTGATIAFLLSRYLFRDTIQNRFKDQLTSFNRALEREGAFYLFAIRLIPAVPFFIINVAMGLTTLQVSTFWWVSQIGMLAGTCVYVYAGSTIPSLSQLANPSLLRADDIQDWPAFTQRIAKGTSDEGRNPSRQIWDRLSDDDQETFMRIANGSVKADEETTDRLILSLNDLMRRPDLTLISAWQEPFVSESHTGGDDHDVDGQSEKAGTMAKRIKKLTDINRDLLVLIFPNDIREPQPILSKQLIIAFVVLGLFPIVVKKSMQRIQSRKPKTESS